MKLLKSALAVCLSPAAAVASATTLTSTIHVDNGYQAFISTSDSVQGTLFSAWNDWMHGKTNVVTLAAGQDYFLHIYGYDQGGIAGFIGQFSLDNTDHTFANGTTTLFSNVSEWVGNNTGFNGSYTSLTDLGSNGASPWGIQADVSSAARWVWAGNADFNDAAYFSTRISAASASVPEPASLAIFGLGLFVFAISRKKSPKA